MKRIGIILLSLIFFEVLHAQIQIYVSPTGIINKNIR